MNDSHMLNGMIWPVGSVGSTVVESDEQVLVSMPSDGHMALYEVCRLQLFYASTHPVDGARDIIFSGRPSVCDLCA